MSNADPTNETASTTMAVSRPRTAVTTPPTAAPTTSIVPHSEPDSAFAVARSSSSTRLGSAAADAGSNAALKHAMTARSGIHHPHDRRALHHQESQAQHGAGDVGDDHQPFPVEPVGQHARERRHDEVRQVLRRQQERDGERGVGQVDAPARRARPAGTSRRRARWPTTGTPCGSRGCGGGARSSLGRRPRGFGWTHVRPRFVRLPARNVRGGRHARRRHVVPPVRAPVQRRRADGLHRSVGDG